MDLSYNIKIGDFPIKTPVAISSMAGIVNGSYIRDRAEYIGIGFIGGYAIDERTINAAHTLVEEGREEFLPKDPFTEIEKQVALIEPTGVIPAVNIRASEVTSLVRLTEVLKNRVIYEIDAHCRQQAMIDAGCGEFLLTHPEHLIAYIQTLKIAGVTVSVKMRAGVSDDDVKLTHLLWKAGADILHIDLMDFGHEKLRNIRNASPIFLIANNSINSYEQAKEMFAHGADMVSLARNSDPTTLREIEEGIQRFTKDHGWYNAPKQLCRGGDIRSLAFCCMPVKPCPLLPTLKKYDITPQEYVDLKTASVSGTPLEEGAGTCFGSLVYCCKDTTPCMFRDATLRQAGVKKSSYMDQKRILARKILDKIFS